MMKTQSTKNNIFECISIDINDDLLKDAKIAAYMANQELPSLSGKLKPYNPKAFPNKAVVIIFQHDGKNIQIYLDAKKHCWNSIFKIDGHAAKLSTEQLDAFFSTQFYKRLVNALSNIWPTSDPSYAKLYEAVMDCRCSEELSEDEIELNEEDVSLLEVDTNQPRKNKAMANKDDDQDGKRDYSGSGRRIVNFSDIGASSKGAEYYCWPRTGKEYKWNSWKEWKKQKPFAKMTFKHNGRKYMISISLFDEQFDHRGFRGADTEWKPPFAWLTPEECDKVMKLSIVRKFLKQCIKRVKSFINQTPEEIHKKIDKPEKVDVKEIEKTIRVIKHVLNSAFKEQQADDYKYDR